MTTPRSTLLISFVWLAAPCGAQPATPSVGDLVAQLANPAQRDHARTRLLRHGGRAVPSLLAALARRDENREVQLDHVVLGVLTEIGAPAARAVPRLLALLEDVPLDQAALVIRALGDLGPYAPDRAATRQAIWRFHAWLQNHADVPVLVPIGEQIQRTDARLQVDPGAPIDELLELFGTATDLSQLEFVMQVLGDHGAAAQPALPRLAAYLRLLGSVPRGDALRKHIRADFVALAITRIAPGDAHSGPAHRHLLQHGGERQRAASALALGRLQSDRYVQDLVRAVRDESDAVAREAVTALGMLGPLARGARTVLEGAAKSADRQIALRARAALARIGS